MGAAVGRAAGPVSDVLTPEEVAERLNLDTATVRRALNAGEIPGRRRLGHASALMSMDVYAHVGAESDRDVARLLDEAIGR